MKNLTIDLKAGNAGSGMIPVVGNNGWVISFRSNKELEDAINGVGSVLAYFDNVDGEGEDECYYVEGSIEFKNNEVYDYDGVYSLPKDVENLVSEMMATSGIEA